MTCVEIECHVRCLMTFGENECQYEEIECNDDEVECYCEEIEWNDEVDGHVGKLNVMMNLNNMYSCQKI